VHLNLHPFYAQMFIILSILNQKYRKSIKNAFLIKSYSFSIKPSNLRTKNWKLYKPLAQNLNKIFAIMRRMSLKSDHYFLSNHLLFRKFEDRLREIMSFLREKAETKSRVKYLYSRSLKCYLPREKLKLINWFVFESNS